MITLEEALLDLDVTPEGKYACDVCARRFPAFGISVDSVEDVIVVQDVETYEEPADPADPEGETTTVTVPVTVVDTVGAICTECRMDADRLETAAAEATALAELQANEPWATDLGLAVKAERNRRIDSVRWVVDPLTSPLSEACQAAFVAYIGELNTLTLDFAAPEEVEWPTEPELEYPAT